MARPSRRPAIRSRFSSADSNGASRRRGPSIGACSITALAGRRLFVVGFMVAVLASFALAPYLGRNFFPPIESTQIALHVRAPTGMRIEETAVEVDRIEAAIRSIIPPESLTHDRRQHRPADQRHQHGLLQYRNDRRVGRGHSDHPEGRPRGGSAGICEGYARDPAGPVSGNDLRLPARGHRDANSQFRPAGADRRADHRPENRRQPRLCGQDSRAHRPGPGGRRRAHPAGVQRADVRRRRRSNPGRNSSA